jgi:hypothetical protein
LALHGSETGACTTLGQDLEEAMTDPEDIFKGVIKTFLGDYAAFGNALVELLRDWGKARVRPDKIASNYFREMGDALRKVHAELAKKKVPRIDGTRLNLLLQSFAAKTSKVRGEKVSPTFKSTLTGAANAAKLLDAWALDRIQLEEAQRVRLLAHIERAAGKSLALAALLKSDT